MLIDFRKLVNGSNVLDITRIIARKIYGNHAIKLLIFLLVMLSPDIWIFPNHVDGHCDV